MEIFLRVTKYVFVRGFKGTWQERFLRWMGGRGRGKVGQRGRTGVWAAAIRFVELGYVQAFLTFTSFESPVIVHSLADRSLIDIWLLKRQQVPRHAYLRRKHNKAITSDFGYQLKFLSLNFHHSMEYPSFLCSKHFPQFTIASWWRWMGLHLAF